MADLDSNRSSSDGKVFNFDLINSHILVNMFIPYAMTIIAPIELEECSGPSDDEDLDLINFIESTKTMETSNSGAHEPSVAQGNHNSNTYNPSLN